MPSKNRGSVEPEGAMPLMGLAGQFGGCGVAVVALLVDGLPMEFCRAAVARAVAVETGPLTVLLAPSPKPTKLAFPSSLRSPVLEASSSGSSLILSVSSPTLTLAHVVLPPTLPVALALPTVLRSFTWGAALSK